MKNIIFYFAFQTEDGDVKVHAFQVDHTELLYSRLGILCFEELEDLLYDTAVEEVESRYGVHDWASSPAETVDGIGFISYEISPEDIPAVMAWWRAWFSDRCALVSQVYTLPASVLSGSDADIYAAVSQQIADEFNTLLMG